MPTLDDALARTQGRADVRSVASVLSEASKEYGYVLIYSFPDLDSVLAGSLVVYICDRNGVDAAITVTPEPPEKLECPTLLLGYPSEALDKISRVESEHVALVAPHQVRQGISKITVIGRSDTSITAMAAAALTELTVVGDAAVVALVAGLWRGFDSGKRAEFIGLESSIAESLELEGKLRSQLTLRLFRWFEDPLEKALQYTLDPFIPGITGCEEGVAKLLSSDPRLSKLSGRSVAESDETLLAVLAEKLYDLLKKVSRVPRRPSELVGYAYQAVNMALPDPREAAYVYEVYAEIAGVLMIASLLLAPESVSGAAYYTYLKEFARIVETLEQLVQRGVEIKALGPLKLAELSSERVPLAPIERQARLLGLIPSDAVGALKTGEGYVVLLETVLRVYGFRWLSKALERGCLEAEPGEVLAVVHLERCGA